jgi:hypothetical protein
MNDGSEQVPDCITGGRGQQDKDASGVRGCVDRRRCDILATDFSSIQLYMESIIRS